LLNWLNWRNECSFSLKENGLKKREALALGAIIFVIAILEILALNRTLIPNPTVLAVINAPIGFIARRRFALYACILLIGLVEIFNENYFVRDCIEILSKETRETVDFLRRNLVGVGVICIFTLMCYGFEIANFTLSFDEEKAVLDFSPIAWIPQSRFGITLIDSILVRTSNQPFWSTFLAVLFLVLTGFYWCRLFERAAGAKGKNLAAVILFCAFFISFPPNFEYMSLINYNLEVTLGLLFAAISVGLVGQWCVHGKSKANLILGIFFLAFSISIYQSNVSVFITGMFAYLLVTLLGRIKNGEEIHSKQIYIFGIKYIAAIGASVLVYAVVDRFLKLFIQSSSYLDTFLKWNSGNMLATLGSLIGQIVNFYLNIKTGLYGGVWGAEFLLPVTVICIILAIWLVIKNRGYRTITALLFAGLLLAPLSISIFLGMVPPMRTTQAFALYMGVAAYLLFTQVEMALLKKILLFLAVIVAVYQSQALNAIFYGDYLRYQKDIAFANRIAERISELEQGEIPKQPVVYIGRLDIAGKGPDSPIIKTRWGGTSFFEYKSRRILFMDYLGFPYKNAASNDELKRAEELAKSMPVWPARDSVALKDGLIIVKLAEPAQ
jgi:hypothetical protein